MTAAAEMTVPAFGLGLNLKFTGSYWYMWLSRSGRWSYRTVAFAIDSEGRKPPRFRATDDETYEIWLGAASFDLPKASWERAKAWVEQVTNATPEGDNRGVPAGGSHAGPDAAAGKPDAAVEGALQPSPHDDAPPGLQQVAGRQALPVQSETPAGAA